MHNNIQNDVNPIEELKENYKKLLEEQTIHTARESNLGILSIPVAVLITGSGITYQYSESEDVRNYCFKTAMVLLLGLFKLVGTTFYSMHRLIRITQDLNTAHSNLNNAYFLAFLDKLGPRGINLEVLRTDLIYENLRQEAKQEAKQVVNHFIQMVNKQMLSISVAETKEQMEEKEAIFLSHQMKNVNFNPQTRMVFLPNKEYKEIQSWQDSNMRESKTNQVSFWKKCTEKMYSCFSVSSSVQADLEDNAYHSL